MVAGNLAEVTRALQLESRHVGSVVLARADGTLVGVVGDRNRIVFPRSSIKIIQALPLIESGAADRYEMTSAELACACASHSGTPFHVATIAALLARIGIPQKALACGTHLPLGEIAKRHMLASKEAACALHNNCSGKHAGMLAVAHHEGEPLTEYEIADHPVQMRIRQTLAEVTGADLSHAVPGVDGCSVPNWPLPLMNLAVGFARIVTGKDLPPARAAAFERLLAACWAEPVAMAGEGRFDTEMLSRFAGEVFVKGGAEGVYCGGIRSKGIGFALKADDGAGRGAEAAAAAIIAHLVDGAEDLAGPKVLLNARGIAVGDIRAGDSLLSVLNAIQANSEAG